MVVYIISYLFFLFSPLYCPFCYLRIFPTLFLIHTYRFYSLQICQYVVHSYIKVHILMLDMMGHKLSLFHVQILLSPVFIFSLSFLDEFSRTLLLYWKFLSWIHVCLFAIVQRPLSICYLLTFYRLWNKEINMKKQYLIGLNSIQYSRHYYK